MAQAGWLDEKGKPVSFEQALAEAMEHGSWGGFPYEILAGMHRQVTKPRPDGITVTQLLGCPRAVFLEANNDYYVAPEDNYFAFRGSVIHGLLEYAGDEAVVEERLQREHRGVVISGQPDNIRLRTTNGHTLLRDWKSTDKLPLYDNAYTHHQQQVNLYRWLKELDPRRTDIEIVYISMTGVKVIPLKKGGVNRYGRALAEQVWDDEKVEKFLDERLMPLAAQRKYEAPVSYDKVDEDDLWQCAYCPVRRECYALAAQEAKAVFENGGDVTRWPPRERKEKK